MSNREKAELVSEKRDEGTRNEIDRITMPLASSSHAHQRESTCNDIKQAQCMNMGSLALDNVRDPSKEAEHDGIGMPTCDSGFERTALRVRDWRPGTVWKEHIGSAACLQWRWRCFPDTTQVPQPFTQQ
jgi:hypothetical protein